MEVFKITSGDFLKNAGIVGMMYMLDLSDAQRGKDYDIEENGQSLWLRKEFAIGADWTDMYFKAFVEYLGPFTVYQTILEKIQSSLDKIRSNAWNVQKTEKDDLKFINEKLLSNSYQAGFLNIRDSIQNPEVYEKLKKEKLSDKMSPEELRIRLEALLVFLQQPLCKETFSMKSIVYNYINRFWNGKSFLLKTNAKLDMRVVFEQEFSGPLRRYWERSHEKDKEFCIDCEGVMEPKEKVSIAFMNDMADDLTRKRSAFWNCKVDAFLCPVCAFLYASSPLGFLLVGNKFVFINTNESVSALWESNLKNHSTGMMAGKKADETYSTWFARIMNLVLSEKIKELSNIQIILRGTNAEDHYLLQIIHKDILNVLKDEKVRGYLKKLAQHPIVKIGNEYLNVYECVILNVLQYHHQYALLNRLLKAALESEGVAGTAYIVYCVQLQSDIIKNEKGGNVFMNRMIMRDSGYALRKALLASKGAATDECLRGTIYQLLNALSVRNDKKFIEIVMRIYCSSNLLIPDGFVQMLGNTELFQQYGYAFVLGLKGSRSEKKEETANE